MRIDELAAEDVKIWTGMISQLLLFSRIDLWLIVGIRLIICATTTRICGAIFSTASQKTLWDATIPHENISFVSLPVKACRAATTFYPWKNEVAGLVAARVLGHHIFSLT